MGTCLGKGSSSNTNTNPSTPAVKKAAPNYSSDITKTDSSGTTSSSSAGKSQFSAATSDQGGNSYNENEMNPAGAGQIQIPMLDSNSDLKVFSLADLKTATKNFKPETFLGQGGFGMVYKGWIDNNTFAPSRPGTGMLVAVKKLNAENGTGQGVKEWKSEIQFLGRQSHPNLVKLLGYCCENAELLLVYEFMQKGSLDNHLFGSKALVEPLPWDTRLKIILGAARGLAFLHSAEEHIIYRDFKTANILLDENYNAKISDFGLARFGPSGGDSHVSTEAIGTHGYAAPEYIHTGHLYVRSDVYGFGVVMLEIMTGQRAFDRTRGNGRQSLVEWMKPLLQKRKLKSIMDGKLEGQYPRKAMLLAVHITLKCLEEDPNNRPFMQEVVHVLEQIQGMKDKPNLITKIKKNTPSS